MPARARPDGQVEEETRLVVGKLAELCYKYGLPAQLPLLPINGRSDLHVLPVLQAADGAEGQPAGVAFAEELLQSAALPVRLSAAQVLGRCTGRREWTADYDRT